VYTEERERALSEFSPGVREDDMTGSKELLTMCSPVPLPFKKKNVAQVHPIDE
jgi:hypothetical protein